MSQETNEGTLHANEPCKWALTGPASAYLNIIPYITSHIQHQAYAEK